MRPRVVILVDNSRRDLLACRLLQDEFLSRGVDARLCSKRGNIMELRRTRPDAYISSRGDFPWLQELSRCCNVYVVPAEGARLTNETMTAVFTGRAGDGWKDDFGPDSFDFIRRSYLWGSETQDVLLGTGLFKPERLMVTGNVRFDSYMHRKPRPAPAGGKLRIGVAFSAKTTSAFNGRLQHAKTFYEFDERHLEKLSLVPPGRYLEDWMWRDLVALRRMMQVTRRLVETTGHEIVLRVGMQEDVQDYLFLRDKAPDRVEVQDHRGQLYDFFSDIDVLLTCSSTVGVEALAMQVPVIATLFTVDRDHLLAHVDPRTNGFDILERIYHSPRTDEGVFALLDQAAKGDLPLTPDPAFLADFLKRLYDWPMARPAAAVIADDVIADIRERPGDKAAFRERLPFGNRRVESLLRALPLPDPALMRFMQAVSELKFLADDWRTGAFRSNREHYTVHNAEVDRLVREYQVRRTSEEG